jgi:hypothetical protein
MGCICPRKDDNVADQDKNCTITLPTRVRTISVNDTVITIDVDSVRGGKGFKTLKDKLSKSQKEFSLDDFTKKLYTEYSNVRSNPSSFIPVLENYAGSIKKYIKKDKLKHYLLTSSGSKIILEDNAIFSFNEAKEFLAGQKSLGHFEKDEMLIVSAKKGLNQVNLDKKKRIDDLRSTLDKFSCEEKEINRLIGHGDYDPKTIIALQLIDPNDNYNSRRAIFSNTYKTIGIYAGFHEKLKLVSITDLAN